MKPLSKADRERARNQKIPKLSELLEIARKANKLVIFDLNSPPRSHPARSSYIRLVVRVILDSKIEQHLVCLSQYYGRGWEVGSIAFECELPCNLPLKGSTPCRKWSWLLI